VTYDRQIVISTGSSRKATKWMPSTPWWSELVERLKTPVRGVDSLDQYLALPKAKQDDLKDVGGFVAGSLMGNRRKANAVTGRDVITLDLDNIPAGGTADTLKRLEALSCAYCVYSTRKHHEAKPRLRVLLPLYRTCTADEYEPLARKMAQLIGLELCDPSTFEASRLMYWPSCNADSQYVYYAADKPMLDVGGTLALYTDWRNVAEWPQVPGTEQQYVKLAQKQGDPLDKTGVVGAFCKTYDIYTALDKFLPGVYEPTDIPGRYTYTGGSTAGGAVIYDDARFLYSHHATDPCSGRLVNAFDLVRLHKFGDLDDEAAAGTPTNRLPSFTQMCQLAASDTTIAAAVNAERYEAAVAAFQDVDGETASDWMALLKKSETGIFEKTAENAQIVLDNDPRFKGKVRYDDFSHAIIVAGPLPWCKDDYPRRWSDKDSSFLFIEIEKLLKLKSMPLINAAFIASASLRSFHPVKEYLSSLVWDGLPRLDRLFIDYLGAADTEYTRAVTRKAFAAAAARVTVPGCKYDTMLILVGKQGRGKSTILSKMGGQWFSDSIKSFEGKEAMESIQGKLILEVAELDAMNRSEIGAVKSFLSKTEDHFRAAYGRFSETHKRQCVFFGTTNHLNCLQDPTGGRRFWPIDIDQIPRTKSVFEDLDTERDQIWAEAFTAWQLGEPLYLSDKLAVSAYEAQESHRETHPWEAIIKQFVDHLIPEDWYTYSLEQRRVYWYGGMRNETKIVERTKVCAIEIWCEALLKNKGDLNQRDARQINQLLAELPGWERTYPTQMGPDYGCQRGFRKVSNLQTVGVPVLRFNGSVEKV